MRLIHSVVHPLLLKTSWHYRYYCQLEETTCTQGTKIRELGSELRKKELLKEFITKETERGSLIWLLTTQEDLTLVGTVKFQGKDQQDATWKIYSDASYKFEVVLRAETEMHTAYNTNVRFMVLVDLFTYEHCQGYGSIFMDYFKPYCAKRGCSYISGFLSSGDTKDTRDSEHGARMLHFYQKHGFKTRLKENGDGGIFLDLAKSEYHVDDSEPI